MKYLLLSFPLLTGCESISWAATEPSVQTAIVDTAQKAVTGDWTGAAVGSVTTIGALITVIAGKYLRDALRNSQPGSIV